MDKVLIVMASSSAANSVKIMLEKRYKIYAEIVQIPSKLSAYGCSFGIKVNMSELKTVLSLLKMSDMTVRGVYDSVTHKEIKL